MRPSPEESSTADSSTHDSPAPDSPRIDCATEAQSQAATGPHPSSVSLADSEFSQSESQWTRPQRFADDQDASGPLPRNFLVLAAYQIIVRIGWIFKTESIIMPALLDSLGGSSLLRGCLPLLNRLGQSVPPLLAAEWLRARPLKKRVLLSSTMGMGISFLAIAVLSHYVESLESYRVATLFLALYGLFFASIGLNQQVFGTLQGKLIPAEHRGRLFWIATLIGSVAAMGFAWWLLPRWLSEYEGQFLLIFGFAGVCFLVAGLLCPQLSETADHHAGSGHVRDVILSAFRTVPRQANFQRLLAVAFLFGASLILFPHYQAIGRGERLQMTLKDLMLWVIIQNAGTAVFGIIAGTLADSRGNRGVLKMLLLLLALAPVTAIALSYAGPSARLSFSMVFVLIGLTPVTLRILNNYTLEICEPSEQPRHLAMLSFAVALPVFSSPLFGWLIDWVGFDPVFYAISVTLLLAWFLTWGLREPRHEKASR